jgi:hypothetical protein
MTGFLERQQRWMQMKNMKRDRLAEAKQAKELDECTFRPETQSKFFTYLTFSRWRESELETFQSQKQKKDRKQ